MRILVVDDSKAMRTIVIRTLRQAGYGDHVVQEAANGIEALKVIQAGEPDLVLSDWNMPDMSGLELLQTLRAQGSKVRFGFVTSEGSPEMRHKAAEAGALFLISKPFTADAMKVTLNKVL